MTHLKNLIICVPLTSSDENNLYIFWTHFHYLLCDLQIFFQCVSCLYLSLTEFCSAKVFNLLKCRLIFICIFCCILKLFAYPRITGVYSVILFKILEIVFLLFMSIMYFELSYCRWAVYIHLSQCGYSNATSFGKKMPYSSLKYLIGKKSLIEFIFRAD